MGQNMVKTKHIRNDKSKSININIYEGQPPQCQYCCRTSLTSNSNKQEAESSEDLISAQQIRCGLAKVDLFGRACSRSAMTELKDITEFHHQSMPSMTCLC